MFSPQFAMAMFSGPDSLEEHTGSNILSTDIGWLDMSWQGGVAQPPSQK